MTESSDQSNPHQGTSRKQKSSIKNKICNFFKPGIETQLHIKNMVLTDIPTQTTPVFIHIRQGRERRDTQAVKIIDNEATWQDEIIIDSRVPSIDSQQQQQQQQRQQNINTNNNATSQQTNSSSQRPRSMSNIHDYDNYDNYDNYEYEQPDENDNAASTNNKEQQSILDTSTNSSSKSQEKSERRKEKKERRELERREKKEKREKEKREKKENKEKEKKEKRERKPQNSSNSFCLEFTFRLEDVSGRSSTMYGRSVLDLTQISSAKNWEYQALLHECNYESRFSCLISIKMKKRKSSAMVETLPPIPTSNSNSNGKNPSQAGILPPQAKMPSSLGLRYEKNAIYRNSIERSYTDRPIRNILIHNSASFDTITNFTNKEISDSPENELNDNFSIDESNNNSEAVSYSSSKRHRTSSSMRAITTNNNNDNSNNTRWSFNVPKSHSHTRSTHNHRKNEPAIKSIASTIIIPLDQNENEDDIEEKLPFKVQKDRLERLTDQVDDIINNVFYGFSED